MVNGEQNAVCLHVAYIHFKYSITGYMITTSFVTKSVKNAATYYDVKIFLLSEDVGRYQLIVVHLVKYMHL